MRESQADRVYDAIVSKPGRPRTSYARITGLTPDQVSRALHTLIGDGRVEFHGDLGHRFYRPVGVDQVKIRRGGGASPRQETVKNGPVPPVEMPESEERPEMPIPPLKAREAQPGPKRNRERQPARTDAELPNDPADQPDPTPLPRLKPRSFRWHLLSHLMSRPSRWTKTTELASHLGWNRSRTSRCMSGLMEAGYLEKHPDDRKKARHFRFRPARQGVGLDYVIAKQPTKSMTEPAPKDPDQHKPEPAQPVRRVVTTTAPKIPTPKEAEQDPAIAALFACRVELVTKLDRIDRAIAILRGEQ